MKYFIVLIILTFPIAAVAQDTTKVRRFTGLALTFSPQYSYRSLHFDADSRWLEALRDNEVPGTGFKARAQVRYRISDRIDLLGGVEYANHAIKTRYEDLTWSGDAEGLPGKSRTIYRYKFLALPLHVNYTFASLEHLRVYAVSGVTTSVFLSRKTKVDMADDHHASAKTVGFARFTWSATLGAGLEYALGHRFSLRAEPFIEHYFNSISTDDHTKEYLFAFGLSTGVVWAFKG
ncbi:outer membrane beta-barrel protein [Fulvivirgaceae bacterium PWU5]|uniref:Outer membrane beta-barrel protein n=1 Tax=Dawidia cretensis TaxID=2782350 RepID=A0AAP2GVU8_9BACT|nr:outer membrane beta-barrel protein [Dawidia cretensis]MBT1711165.1 outer membrane beta-barrel protein [Dawidia cretensis]